jgi:5-methylcytosine-specific restriction endonuclease McrA
MPGNTVEYNASYYQKNRERIVALRAIKRATKEHKEQRKEYHAKYHKENPHKSRQNQRRRRATEKQVKCIPYTEQNVLDIYGVNCHICNMEIDLAAPRQAGKAEGWENGLHIDHLIPIKNGGEDSIENVRPAHAKCNLQKGSKPLQLLVQERTM